jgi:hypothetical protein
VVGDAQLVLLVEREGDADEEVAGVTLLAVLAQVGEADGRSFGRGDRLGVPHALVEAAQTAVQRVGRVVDGELVGHLVEGELAACDAVGVTADRRAEIILHLEVRRELVEAEHDVVEFSIAVRHPDAGDGRAVIHDADAHAGLVGQRVQGDRHSAVAAEITRGDGVGREGRGGGPRRGIRGRRRAGGRVRRSGGRRERGEGSDENEAKRPEKAAR